MTTNKEMDFSRSIIKGRIAEIIFEQMIRAEGRYTVIPFGYENTLPLLAQHREKFSEVDYIIKNISEAPDFVLLSPEKSQVFLVEIKYQSVLDIEKLLEYAFRLQSRWLHVFLFVVTPTCFYCDYAGIVYKKKSISPLPDSWVSLSRQKQYLKLLSEFDKRKNSVIE